MPSPLLQWAGGNAYARSRYLTVSVAQIRMSRLVDRNHVYAHAPLSPHPAESAVWGLAMVVSGQFSCKTMFPWPNVGTNRVTHGSLVDIRTTKFRFDWHLWQKRRAVDQDHEVKSHFQIPYWHTEVGWNGPNFSLRTYGSYLLTRKCWNSAGKYLCIREKWSLTSLRQMLFTSPA